MKILITNISMYYLVYFFRNVVTLHLINIMMQNSESVSIQDKLKFITLFAERLGVISPISSASCRGVSRFAESRCGVTRRTNAATRRPDGRCRVDSAYTRCRQTPRIAEFACFAWAVLYIYGEHKNHTLKIHFFLLSGWLV